MTTRPAGPARTLLGRPVLLTVLAGLVAVPVAAWASGREGVVAALIAVGLVLGFLLVGQLPVAQAARAVDAAHTATAADGRYRAGTSVLILVYTVRLMVTLLAFRALSVSDGVDRDVLGLTIVACGLAWTVGTVWSALRWRPMVVEPDEPAEQRW